MAKCKGPEADDVTNASEVQASPHPGMGAVLCEDGVTFRVWAPHADQVWVMGSFNGWDRKGAAFTGEEDGRWSVHMPGLEAGDQYKFVICNGEQILEKNDPYARVTDVDENHALVYDPEAFDWGDEQAYRMPPWNELVLYEMHVGTFNDSDPGDEDPGDFRQAMEKLDYLADLGINGIAMMPVAEFPGKRNWGYNTTYPFAVERAYGGPDGLKRLVREAHGRGIAVIMDVIYNHFGPMELDLWRFDGWGEGEAGGIYFYGDHRAETPWGHTRPDYGRPEVCRYIRDNVFMWLDEFRMDGLRFDGTVFIRKLGFLEGSEENQEGWALLRSINAAIKERMPGKFIIAEDLQGEEVVSCPVEEGGGGFDSQWDAAFDHRIREAVVPHADDRRKVEPVWKVVEHCYNDDLTHRLIYTESHDAVSNGRARVPYEINKENPESWDAKKRSTLAASLVFTAPGVPMLFQGQEFLEDAWFDVDHPLDWEKPERLRGIRLLYRDMIALRRNLRGFTGGLTGHNVNVFHKNRADKLFAFHRWAENRQGDDTIVVVNFTKKSYADYCLGFPNAGLWRVRFNSDWDGYSEDFSSFPSDDVYAVPEPMDGFQASGSMSIGPYTTIILSQDPNE